MMKKLKMKKFGRENEDEEIRDGKCRLNEDIWEGNKDEDIWDGKCK